MPNYLPECGYQSVFLSAPILSGHSVMIRLIIVVTISGSQIVWSLHSLRSSPIEGRDCIGSRSAFIWIRTAFTWKCRGSDRSTFFRHRLTGGHAEIFEARIPASTPGGSAAPHMEKSRAIDCPPFSLGFRCLVVIFACCLTVVNSPAFHTRLNKCVGKRTTTTVPHVSTRWRKITAPANKPLC